MKFPRLVFGNKRNHITVYSKRIKTTSISLVIVLLYQSIFPTQVFGLTAGPKSPDFSTFTPVTATDMVDLASGDFKYNLPVLDIPGPDGGGYALSLSYLSNVNPEQESSWVGFGWTLNPGSINRNTRGLPDDYNEETVHNYNKARPNFSISAADNVGMEILGLDLPISLTRSTRFNNFKGYSTTTGFGLNKYGLSASFSWDQNGEFTFTPDINVRALLEAVSKKLHKNPKYEPELNRKGEVVWSVVEDYAGRNKVSSCLGKIGTGLTKFHAGTSIYGFFSPQFGGILPKYTSTGGFSFTGTFVSLRVDPTLLPAGPYYSIDGNFNMQYNHYFIANKGYGYLHSDDVSDTDETIMDYHIEKEAAYDKRDLFIGMPFADYDIFNASGEGVQGAFRAHAITPGYFKPTTGKSSLVLLNGGVEFSIGANIGIGFDVGAGVKSNSVSEWDENNTSDFGSDYIFKFEDDMGSNYDLTPDDTEVPNVSLTRSGDIPGTRYASSTNVFEDIAKPETDRTSYVEYIIKSESEYSEETDYSDVSNDAIVGFIITNESGVKYTYGRPLFTKNQANISIDIDPNSHDVVNNYFAYRDLALIEYEGSYVISDDALKGTDLNTVIGDIKPSPNANTFLLTAITGPDYVDLNNDGPTEDDFGSWTKFNYEKHLDSYRYRSPYYGFKYLRNNISDTRDDLGSVFTGEKEVFYLSSIETKTHIAEFVTSTRDDGLSAMELDSDGDPAASVKSQRDRSDNKKLKKLDRIDLYSKTRPDKPLKSVVFEYDYSLVKNLPNNVNVSGDDNTGKLTLKKLWFEYEGISNSTKTRPYIFNYQYCKSGDFDAGSDFFTEYDELPEGVQNPSYSPHLLGPWGTTIPFAKERHGKDILWEYQGKLDVTSSDGLSDYNDWRNSLTSATVSYDPAAWNLKQIILPSGGEINIQYEEKDYLYVQDRPAMAMVSLLPDYLNNDDGKFAINVEDLGIDPNDIEALEDLKEKIEDYYLTEDNPKKIYYRFLYALVDENPSLENEKSEYITGYATISDVYIDGNSIILNLKGSNSSTGGYTQIPKSACEEYYRYNRFWMYNTGVTIDYIGLYENGIKSAANELQPQYPQGSSGSSAKGLFKTAIAIPALVTMTTDKVRYGLGDIAELGNNVCKELEPTQSFLKIPTLYAKRGGGARVKRLLLYDQGIESGSAVVYGNQYHYVLEDGVTSSGVASNEPNGAREENPLVGFLGKESQDFWNRITTGQDKEQLEGPLGESMLPTAKITYSRTVVENIHTGSTGTGYAVHEYYTSKDYPFDKVYASSEDGDFSGQAFDKSELNKEKDFMYLPAGLINFKVEKLWMTQGFRFILNSMDGVPKRVTNYGGSYQIPTTTNNLSRDTGYGYIVSQQSYEYFEPGEKIKIWEWEDGTINETSFVPGKDVDMAAVKKKAEDITTDFSIEVDLSTSVSFFPIFGITIWPSFSRFTKLLATHSATKIIRYPVILKKVRFYQEGMSYEKENMVFDKATGSPLIVRTSDSYNNIDDGTGEKTESSYYTADIPAYWFYEKMGQKSTNSSYKNMLKAVALKVQTYGDEESAMPTTESIAKSGDPIDLSLTNVLAFTAQSYKSLWSDSWNDSKISSRYELTSGINTSLNSIWRAWSTHIYKKDLDNSQLGLFDIDEEFYLDPTEGTNSSNWVKASEVTKYSPNGNPLEEVNALGIYSSVLYDKASDFIIPSMVAGNAQYNSIYFNSFEQSGFALPTGTAHSGALVEQYYSATNILEDVYVTDQLIEDGGILSVWIRENEEELTASIGSSVSAAYKAASVGEWSLYNFQFSGKEISDAYSEGDLLDIGISGFTDSYLIVDDVRFYPQEAQATCYVYDDAYRLVAQLDDQHFGTYFQYNDEGQLVRKIIETERGKKTIQETQYNTSKR